MSPIRSSRQDIVSKLKELKSGWWEKFQLGGDDNSYEQAVTLSEDLFQYLSVHHGEIEVAHYAPIDKASSSVLLGNKADTKVSISQAIHHIFWYSKQRSLAPSRQTSLTE